jgi:hypothetical protein
MNFYTDLNNVWCADFESEMRFFTVFEIPVHDFLFSIRNLCQRKNDFELCLLVFELILDICSALNLNLKSVPSYLVEIIRGLRIFFSEKPNFHAVFGLVGS